MASSSNSKYLSGYFTPASNLRGRHFFSWSEWSSRIAEQAEDIALHARHARLRRVKDSHRGLAERKELRHLIASTVDQSFLDEICTIEGLQRLELQWPMTATDLAPLRQLRQLERLHIDGAQHASDFLPLLDLPKLRFLFIQNARCLGDAQWLSQAHHLEAIGIEGSIWTMQRLPSLAPFAGLRSLRGLFLGSVRLDDTDLSPLADCPRLEVLECARFAPRKEFQHLQMAKPGLRCSWFDPSAWDKA